MPTAVFVSEGNAIDYTPTADVAAGDVVVQGELVGIAKTPIAANTPGALTVTGVFDLPKATGAGTAIPVGSEAYWTPPTKWSPPLLGPISSWARRFAPRLDGDPQFACGLKQ